MNKYIKITIIVVTVLIVISLVTSLIFKTSPGGIFNNGQTPTPTAIILPPEVLKVDGPNDKVPQITNVPFPTYTLRQNDPIKTTIPNTQNIPTIDPADGGGVNTDSPSVTSSTQAIQNLSGSLPLTIITKLSTGLTVNINIPSEDLQNNTWTLFVDVQNINFQVAPQENSYKLMKNSFREAASDVFAWIRTQNVDPSQIYFVWGTKAYQQQTAENWLKNN